MKLICVFVLWIALRSRSSCFVIGNQLHNACKSPQYLEFGKTGTITCVFDEDTVGVLWYNTTDYTNHDPVVDYQNGVKTGAGYASGEFDVNHNGSLIINNVSLKHDKAFHVVTVQLGEGPTPAGDITIIVYIKPMPGFPLIRKCLNSSKGCYINSIDPIVHCSVNNARPRVPITLKVRTVTGDKNVTTFVEETTNGRTFTTKASAKKVFQYTPLLSLLACKASSPPGLLKNDESQILVQNKRFNINQKLEQAVKYNIDLNDTIELMCANESAKWMVWKKNYPFSDFEDEVLLTFISTGGHFAENYHPDSVLGSNGSIVLRQVQVKDEGLYYCIYGDGNSDGIQAYNISVVVHPVPAYPVIDLCQKKPSCRVTTKREGDLTCSLKGVRPLVQLHLETFSEKDSDHISFYVLNQTSATNGDTFDLTLSVRYSLLNLSLKELRIKCTVLETNQVNFWLTSTLELSFEKDLNDESEYGIKAATSNTLQKILIPVGALALIILVVLIVLAVRRRKCIDKRNKSSSAKIPENNQEEIPLVHICSTQESKAAISVDGDVINLDAKRQSFIDELKIKYRMLYNAVQPIALPTHDDHRCVNDIFVEGGIEIFNQTESGRKEWQSIASHTDILNVIDDQTNRIIVEGDVGYGKSTLTLKMAYDWCNNKTTVAGHEQIFILLDLKDKRRSTTSIYRFIKYSLLPENSDIRERDVEIVLKNTKSVLLILDGFERYPETNCDMKKIFNGDMFPHFKVIITIRSLPELPNQPLRITRFRLRGFTESLRNTYIYNVVTNGNQEAFERLRKSLQHIPLIKDLCETPSYFVLFSHLLNETDDKVKLNSVTSVMKHAITWLEHHGNTKLTADNLLSKYNFPSEERERIGKFAFKAMCGTIWEKKKLREELGTDLYDTLLQTGI